MPAAPVFQTLVNEVRSVLPLAVKGHLYILSSDRLQLVSALTHAVVECMYLHIVSIADMHKSLCVPWIHDL